MYPNLKTGKVEDASDAPVRFVSCKCKMMLYQLYAQHFKCKIMLYTSSTLQTVNYINEMASHSKFGSNVDDESISSVDEGISPKTI
jgi:hypothetical protein